MTANTNPLKDANSFIMTLALSVLGAIIGIQLITTLGISVNTAIIGALIAILISKIPLLIFKQYKSIHAQNIAQTAISSATFGAANSLLVPIAIPYVMGMHDLIIPMLIGVGAAMLLDAYLLYRMFDTKIFPAANAWPAGLAVASAINANEKGGKGAYLLLVGIAAGIIGSIFKIPMAAFGTAFIGNIWALSMFGVGLLLRGYSQSLLGVDLNKLYIPHGIMVGAGLVALLQVVLVIYAKKKPEDTHQGNDGEIKISLGLGSVGYILIAAFLALAAGLWSEMSLWFLLAFVLYSAFAAFAHEIIVGIAAMHSGWFPAFAVALITLIVGILIGFPLKALVVLCGFSVATGPAFADMGYDLKAGFILRGKGQDLAQELVGRRNQLIAAMLAFVTAFIVVALSYESYFAQKLLPPLAAVYAKTIEAGAAPGIATSLLTWAIPGAIIQALGGPKRQLGVLLATGLLILFPAAGWMVLSGIAIRLICLRIWKEKSVQTSEILAGGFIAGDALYSFFNAMFSFNKGK